jgi:hypothetical protein
MDLTEKDCLGFIPDYSIDIAHACLLFSSPTLIKKYGDAKQLKENLIPQLERIVRPEGFFIYY